MKSFSSKSEMLEYGKQLGKYDMEKVLLNEVPFLLCGTNLAYEDKLFEIAATALKEAYHMFKIDKKIKTDDISNFRDLLFETLKDNHEFQIMEVFDQY